MNFSYVWIVSSSAFLLPWIGLWLLAPGSRAVMWRTSFVTALFMRALSVFASGHIAQVWNLPALSGVPVRGIPLEELLFGFAFGMYWTGVYEHLTWRGAPVHTRPLRGTDATA